MNIPATYQTYLRQSLSRDLRAHKLIRNMVVDNKWVSWESVAWDDYWLSVPAFAKPSLSRLKDCWAEYLDKECVTAAIKYSNAFVSILEFAVREANTHPEDSALLAFLRRVIGFECWTVSENNSSVAPAAATTSNRNPMVLYMKYGDVETRKHRRASRILPILGLEHNGIYRFYLSYRSRILCAGSQLQILLYVSDSIELRERAHRCLDLMNEVLLGSWKSFTDSRARRKVKAIFHPNMQCIKSARESGNRSIRILDIGAEHGSHLSSIVRSWAEATGPDNPGYELVLVDVLAARSRPLLSTSAVAGAISQYSVVSQGIKACFGALGAERRFDIALGCLVLHHQSRVEWTTREYGRYGATDLFKDAEPLRDLLVNSLWRADNPGNGNIPSNLKMMRYLPDDALLTRTGDSFIRKVLQHANTLLIEDHILSVEQVVDHFVTFRMDNYSLIDFTRTMRSRTSGIYILQHSNAMRWNGGIQRWPLIH